MKLNRSKKTSLEMQAGLSINSIIQTTVYLTKFRKNVY